MFYLTMHSTHFIYGLYGKGPHRWQERKSAVATWATLRLATRVLLYALSHRQDNTYNGLGYTSRGALAGRTINADRSPSFGTLKANVMFTMLSKNQTKLYIT